MEEDLGDWYDGVAVGLEDLDDPGKGLLRVNGGVVEENDAPGADVLQHPLGNLIHRDTLLVQTVSIP